MRCIKHTIPTKAFKIVAKKIIDQYPNIFRDVDEDGVVLGDGSHSLVCKLQDRNNYLNRPHKRKTTSSLENPVTSKKRLVSAARAGCINWAPQNNEENSPDKENDTNLEETNENFYNMLEKTYPEQRSFINSLPSFAQIKEKWPILCSKKAIFWHFEKLTNSEINLIDEMKSQRFKAFLEHTLRDTYIQNIDQTDELKCVIKNIILYFKEDVKALTLKYKVIK